jgi:hypothetical protein
MTALLGIFHLDRWGQEQVDSSIAAGCVTASLLLVLVLPCDSCGRRQVLWSRAKTPEAAEIGVEMMSPLSELRDRSFRCCRCYQEFSVEADVTPAFSPRRRATARCHQPSLGRGESARAGAGGTSPGA